MDEATQIQHPWDTFRSSDIERECDFAELFFLGPIKSWDEYAAPLLKKY